MQPTVYKFKKILLTLLLLASTSYQLSHPAWADENSCVEVEADPSLSVEEAAAGEAAAELTLQANRHCRKADGSYKQGNITLRHGNDEQVINCQELAQEAYKLALGANCDIDRKGLMSCLTKGWDQRDQFDMFYSLAADPKLEMKIDEHFNCPGKDEDSSAMYGAVACSLMSTAVGSLPGATSLIINNLVPAPQRAQARRCVNSNNNCIAQAMWGVVQNVISNIQGLWELGKMAARGIGRLFGFGKDEDASADQHGLLATFSKEVTNSDIGLWQASKNIVGNFLGGIWSAIKEGTRDQFSCVKWEGGVANTRLGAKCLEAAPSFECATAQQKINMACGVIGFVGGEIVTAFLTGGTVRAASLAGKGASRLSRAAGITARVARIPGAGMGRSVIAKIGGGARSTLSWVGGTAARGARATNSFALKVGNKIVPVGARTHSRILSGLANVASTPLKGAKWYFKKMDEAYSLGRHGRGGAMALAQNGADGARAYAATNRSSNLERRALLAEEQGFRTAAQGRGAFKNLEDAQKAVEDAQQAYRQATAAARRGEAGAQARMDEAFRQYESATASLKITDNAYTAALRAHQEQVVAARLAAEAAEREAQELARRQAAAANQANTSTDITLRSTNRVTGSVDNSTAVVRRTDDVTPGANVNRGTTTNPTPQIGRSTASATDLNTGNLNFTTGQKSELLDGFVNNIKVENKRVAVYRNGADDWSDNVFNPRVEGDKLIGNLGSRNGTAVEIPIEDIAMVDVRGTFTQTVDGVVVKETFVQPLSLSRTTDASYMAWTERAGNSAITRSSDDIQAMLGEMTSMTRAESTRIASVTTYKLSNGIMPTEMEFLAAIKNSAGYRTKVKLPHIEKFRSMYNASSTDEALALLDDIYRGTSSETTTMIRNNIAMMNRRMGNIRENRVIVTTVTTTNEANILLRRSEEALEEVPVSGQNLLPPGPTPLLLTRGDNFLPVVRQADNLVPAARLADNFPTPRLSTGTRTALRTGRSAFPIVSAAALAANALRSDRPNLLPEIVVIGSRNNSNRSYSLSGSYVAGPPPLCSAYIKKRGDDDQLGDPLTVDEMASEAVTLKWFKAEGENEDDLICSGGENCELPSPEATIYAVGYKDGVKFQSFSCSKPADDDANPGNDDTNPSSDDNDDAPFDPYADDGSDGDSGGIDRAEEFRERETSPPPPLFQPPAIPRRPTHYLHSGWY